jgi:hypothetical protein
MRLVEGHLGDKSDDQPNHQSRKDFPMTRYTDDIFDEQNVLRDGKSVRVSMQARDAAMLRHVNSRPRITDGRSNDPMALHRPGFRVPAMNDRRSVVRDAYETYERELCSRWQTDAEVEVEREQHRDNDSNGRTKVEQEYQAYDAALASAWRTPS